MEADQLYHILNQISPVTEAAWADFYPSFQTLELNRNEYLVRQGSTVHDCYLLIDGVIRVYYSKDGNEYNKTFFISGTFPTPLTALLSDSPCALSFQALTHSKLVRFSYKGFRNLFEKHRCLESLLLRILEEIWIKKERHDIRMVTNNATTNYLIFQQEFPGLENLIPQYHIASYLGITPIQLSRIRTQLAKSN